MSAAAAAAAAGEAGAADARAHGCAMIRRGSGGGSRLTSLQHAVRARTAWGAGMACDREVQRYVVHGQACDAQLRLPAWPALPIR